MPSSTDGQTSEAENPGCRPRPGVVRLELVRPPMSGAAVPGDRTGDDAVALGVRRADALGPVRRRLDARRQVGPRLAEAFVHLDVERERRASELGEPRPALGDEVEGEPVRPGRDRAADRHAHGRLLAGAKRRRRRPDPVPDDRVPAPVEPVVREEDALAPLHAPGVLERDRPPRRSLPRAAARAWPHRSRRTAVPSTRAVSLLSVTPLLARAARREQVERTPVWFMRQAGRSLPEYRAIRERHTFWEVGRHARALRRGDAAARAPPRRRRRRALRRHHDPGRRHGPRRRARRGCRSGDRARRCASAEDVERLRVPDPDEAFAPVLEAIGIVRRELEPERAVVGFCGGPFTVAGYLVEGRPSREFATVKSLMYTSPDVWRALLDKLADCFAGYVAAQAARRRRRRAALRLVGRRALARRLRGVRRAVVGAHPRRRRRSDDPLRHRHRDAARARWRAAGGDVIGLDWRVPLDEGWARVGRTAACRATSSPALLLGPWERVEAGALRRARAVPAAAPGTSSTSATACCPPPTRPP